MVGIEPSIIGIMIYITKKRKHRKKNRLSFLRNTFILLLLLLLICRGQFNPDATNSACIDEEPETESGDQDTYKNEQWFAGFEKQSNIYFQVFAQNQNSDRFGEYVIGGSVGAPFSTGDFSNTETLSLSTRRLQAEKNPSKTRRNQRVGQRNLQATSSAAILMFFQTQIGLFNRDPKPSKVVELRQKTWSPPSGGGASITLDFKGVKNVEFYTVDDSWNDAMQTPLVGTLETSDPSNLVIFTYKNAKINLFIIEDLYTTFGCRQGFPQMVATNYDARPIIIANDCNNSPSSSSLIRFLENDIAHQYQTQTQTRFVNVFHYYNGQENSYNNFQDGSIIESTDSDPQKTDIFTTGFILTSDGHECITIQNLCFANPDENGQCVNRNFQVLIKVEDITTAINSLSETVNSLKIIQSLYDYSTKQFLVICEISPKIILSIRAKNMSLEQNQSPNDIEVLMTTIRLVQNSISQSLKVKHFQWKGAESNTQENYGILCENLDNNRLYYFQIKSFTDSSFQDLKKFAFTVQNSAQVSQFVQNLSIIRDVRIKSNQEQVLIGIGGNSVDRPGFMIRTTGGPSKACLQIQLEDATNEQSMYDSFSLAHTIDNNVPQFVQSFAYRMVEESVNGDVSTYFTDQNQFAERNPCLIEIGQQYDSQDWAMVHDSQTFTISYSHDHIISGTCGDNSEVQLTDDNDLSPFESRVSQILYNSNDITSTQAVVSYQASSPKKNFVLQAQNMSQIGQYQIKMHVGFNGITQAALLYWQTQSIAFEVIAPPTECTNLVVPNDEILSQTYSHLDSNKVKEISLAGIFNQQVGKVDQHCDFTFIVTYVLILGTEPTDDKLFTPKNGDQGKIEDLDKVEKIPAYRATPALYEIKKAAKLKIDYTSLTQEFYHYRVTIKVSSDQYTFGDPIELESNFDIKFVMPASFPTSTPAPEIVTHEIGSNAETKTFFSLNVEANAQTTIEIVKVDGFPISDHRFSQSYDPSTKQLTLSLHLLTSLDDQGSVYAKIVESDDSDSSNKVERTLEINFTNPCSSIQIQPPLTEQNTFIQQKVNSQGKLLTDDSEPKFLKIIWSQFIPSQQINLCNVQALSITVENQKFSSQDRLNSVNSSALITNFSQRETIIDLEDLGIKNGIFKVKIIEGVYLKSYDYTILNSQIAEQEYTFEILILENRVPEWLNKTLSQMKFQIDQQIESEKVSQKEEIEDVTFIDNSTQQFEINDYYPKFDVQLIGKESQRPNVINGNITETGLVQLQFSKPLLTPTVFLNSSESNMVKNLTYQIFDIKVMTDFSSFEEIDSQIKSFKVQDFNKSSVFIQIEFLYPRQISLSLGSPDQLKLQILDNQFFRDEIDYNTISKGTEVFIDLPQQVSLAENEEIQIVKESISLPISTFSFWALLINLILAGGLKHLWNFANVIQFFLYFSIWRINLPQKARLIIDELKKIGLFEFIDTKDLLSRVYGIASIQNDTLIRHKSINQIYGQSNHLNNDQIQRINGQSSVWQSVIEDGGVLMIIGVMLLILVIVLAIFKIITRPQSCGRIFYNKLKQKLMFNAIIRFILMSCLKWQVSLSVAVLIQVQLWSYTALYASPFLVLVLITVVPAIFFVILRINRGNLNKKEIKQKIGSLYEGLVPESKATLFKAPIFMVRRTFFVVLTFGLLKFPGIQSLAFIVSTMFYIGYLQIFVKFEERRSKVIETTNEVISVAVTYHFILLTNLVWSIEIREQIGLSLILFIGILIIFNFTVIAQINIRQLIRAIRVYQMTKKAKEIIKEREVALNEIKQAIQLVKKNHSESLGMNQGPENQNQDLNGIELETVRLQNKMKVIDQQSRIKLSQFMNSWKKTHGSQSPVKKGKQKLRSLPELEINDEARQILSQLEEFRRNKTQISQISRQQQPDNSITYHQSRFMKQNFQDLENSETKSPMNESGSKLIIGTFGASDSFLQEFKETSQPYDVNQSKRLSKFSQDKNSLAIDKSKSFQDQVQESEENQGSLKALSDFNDSYNESSRRVLDDQRQNSLQNQTSMKKNISSNVVLDQRKVQTPKSSKVKRNFEYFSQHESSKAPSEAMSQLSVVNYSENETPRSNSLIVDQKKNTVKYKKFTSLKGQRNLQDPKKISALEVSDLEQSENTSRIRSTFSPRKPKPYRLIGEQPKDFKINEVSKHFIKDQDVERDNKQAKISQSSQSSQNDSSIPQPENSDQSSATIQSQSLLVDRQQAPLEDRMKALLLVKDIVEMKKKENEGEPVSLYEQNVIQELKHYKIQRNH